MLLPNRCLVLHLLIAAVNIARKSMTEINAILAETGRLQGPLDPKAAEEYEKAMGRAIDAITGLQRAIVAKVLPEITHASEVTTKWLGDLDKDDIGRGVLQIYPRFEVRGRGAETCTRFAAENGRPAQSDPEQGQRRLAFGRRYFVQRAESSWPEQACRARLIYCLVIEITGTRLLS